MSRKREKLPEDAKLPDWFQDVLERARIEAKAKFPKPPVEMPKVPPRPAEAARAASTFGIVGGSYTSTGPYLTYDPRYPTVVEPRYHRITPEEGLEAILTVVREAGDSGGAEAALKAAGEWITKTTNGITGLVKQYEDFT